MEAKFYYKAEGPFSRCLEENGLENQQDKGNKHEKRNTEGQEDFPADAHKLIIPVSGVSRPYFNNCKGNNHGFDEQPNRTVREKTYR